jgi:hypothetical protein
MSHLYATEMLVDEEKARAVSSGPFNGSNGYTLAVVGLFLQIAAAR